MHNSDLEVSARSEGSSSKNRKIERERKTAGSEETMMEEGETDQRAAPHIVDALPLRTPATKGEREGRTRGVLMWSQETTPQHASA
jgi:hypothetical protein